MEVGERRPAGTVCDGHGLTRSQGESVKDREAYGKAWPAVACSKYSCQR
jgi:hypothetical protein